MILPDPKEHSLATLIVYCSVFGCVTVGAYLFSLWLNKQYLGGYIEKEDDIVGDTDLNRRLVLERRETIKLDAILYTFSYVLLPLSMVILNYALSSTVFRLFFISFDDDSQAKAEKWVLFTSNLGECLGSAMTILVQFVKVKWLFALLGCRITLWFIMALDSTHNHSKFTKVNAVWFMLLFTFAFLSGFLSTQLSSVAVSMVQEKHRKNVGFLLFVCITIGTSYGDFATLFSFTKGKGIN